MKNAFEETVSQNRNYKYDYLRALSCVTVVILHVAAMYVKTDFIDIVPRVELQWASFYRTAVQLAVPSFVMLSGAFLINHRNLEWKKFYKHMLQRIIIPTLVFSVIYVFVHYVENYLAFYLGIIDLPKNKWEPLQNWLNGQPSITMWYMYMIIGLYIITPVMVRIKQSISIKSYYRLGLVLFVYSILVAYTCSLSWILQFMQWIGYFVLGNVIYDYFNSKTYEKLGYVLIFLAYCLLGIHWFNSFKSQIVSIPESFSATVLIGTVLQFIGFSMIPNMKKIDKITSMISKYSLEIYLIHPLFVEVLMQVSGRVVKRFLPAQWIPLYAMLIVVLSCLAGVCFSKTMKKIIRKFNVTVL